MELIDRFNEQLQEKVGRKMEINKHRQKMTVLTKK